MPSLGLSERFERKGDALAAANAQRDHAAAQAVPAHRMGVVQVRVTPKTRNPFTIKALSISGVT
jgi:hypothetical protein